MTAPLAWAERHSQYALGLISEINDSRSRYRTASSVNLLLHEAQMRVRGNTSAPMRQPNIIGLQLIESKYVSRPRLPPYFRDERCTLRLRDTRLQMPSLYFMLRYQHGAPRKYALDTASQMAIPFTVRGSPQTTSLSQISQFRAKAAFMIPR